MILNKSFNNELNSLNYQCEYVDELPKCSQETYSNVYVIRNQGLTELTHIIHKYPGKFIPQIPRWAIENFLDHSFGKVIIDPFCGSGTSLVESHLRGHLAYGTDIDPLARLISKVKTTPIPTDVLQKVIHEVTKEVQCRENSEFRPTVEPLEYWFQPSALRDLGIIREVAEKWRFIDQDIYNFLIICFSAIIRKTSNADNQSLKTYVSKTYPKRPEPVKPLFIKILNEYAKRIISFQELASKEGKTIVLDINDARNFSDEWLKQELPLVDLGITSPPYIKTIDYIYNQMAEYFWIGDLFNLENRKNQNLAKRQYIGTEQVTAAESKQIGLLNISSVDSIISKISERSIKHGYITYRYFSDMRTHFQQMYKVLKSNGVYVVVIGDSSISNLDVETHKLLAEVAHREGFDLECQLAYEIRNRHMRFPRQGRGGIVNLDWILAFRKK